MYHYCVVRADLHEGDLVGNIAAQLIHAAEAHHAPPGTYSAALCLPDEAALLAVRERLVAADIEHHAVFEDAGPYAGQITAIGIAPATKDKLKYFLSSIPSLKMCRLGLTGEINSPRENK